MVTSGKAGNVRTSIGRAPTAGKANVAGMVVAEPQHQLVEVPGRDKTGAILQLRIIGRADHRWVLVSIFGYRKSLMEVNPEVSRVQVEGQLRTRTDEKAIEFRVQHVGGVSCRKGKVQGVVLGKLASHACLNPRANG